MPAVQTLLATVPPQTVAIGTVLLERSVSNDTVIYVDRGRVVLGVVGAHDDLGEVEHQLGVVDGPAWLETTAALLNLPNAVDAVAQTEVQLRRLPVEEFRASLRCGGDDDLRPLLFDLAKSHRQQTEMTVSRLAKDAESRCAEWLLSHAQASDAGGCSVQLQRKRAIAAQLGIAPETLSRVLRHLRELRLISGSGRVVDLVDVQGLRSVAGPSAPCQCGVV